MKFPASDSPSTKHPIIPVELHNVAPYLAAKINQQIPTAEGACSTNFHRGVPGLSSPVSVGSPSQAGVRNDVQGETSQKSRCDCRRVSP